jgi:hypothetical protein
LPSFVTKYDPEGRILCLKHCRFYICSGNLTVDSRGAVYVYDVPLIPPAKAGAYDFPDMTWGYWRDPPEPKGPYMLRRGDQSVTHVPEIAHVVKFGPEGGVRFTHSEQWAHRGASVHLCCGGCDYPANLLACDGADRILAVNVAHYSVNVLDAAGNLINRFGTYGNAETIPVKDDARDLGFRNIYSVSAAGDAVYVSDKDLRRVAKVTMQYRETVKIPAGG